MDIWVRGQNGKGITKIDGMFIKKRHYDKVINNLEFSEICYDLIGTNYNNTQITLGTFDSKTNARKVLGKFAKHIVDMRRPIASYEIFTIPEDKDV